MARNAGNAEAYPVNAYSYGRLSQKKQEDGTGQERQMELAKQWCERKGIPLDETLSFFDKVSGFHGHHLRKDGGLFLFLQACEQGRVKPGSFLLVESLDRLSREQLQEGQALIKRLLFDYRIRLVVLFTGMEYTAENYQQTHWSIDAEFDRAHSESFSKSVRSKDNWERRRRAVSAGGLLTRKVPTWLRVENGKIVADEDKAVVVHNIFDLAVNGFGFDSIAKRLNAAKVPVFGKSKWWRNSIVEKILKSRSVLGEHQAMKSGENGKRVPVGPVLVGYFPAVVTADQWRTAHQAIASRHLARGRISPKVSNLFTHLVYDVAGDAMAFAAKGGVGYLQSGRRETPGIKYAHFENVVLSWFRDIKLTLSNSADIASFRVRADKLAAVLKIMKAKIDAEPDDLADLMDGYAQKKRDHAEIVKQIESATVPLQSHFLQSQRLIEALASAKGDDRETMRRELRQSVRMMIQRIRVQVWKGERGEKRILVIARFKDGHERGIHYKTKGGRVLHSEGLWREGDPAWQSLRDQMIKDLKGKTPTPEQEIRYWEKQGLYYRDPEPANELKTKCKEMRDAGKSYKAIEAATGLHRTSIYRLINDYVRRGTKDVKQPVPASEITPKAKPRRTPGRRT